MGPWFSYYFPRAEIDEMMHDADTVGIEKLCIAPHASISSDYKLGNVQVTEAIAKYPERIYGYLAVNGNMPEEMQGEFDRYYSSPSFIGVKIHPSLHKYSVAGDNYFIAYEKVDKLGGFVLTHTWYDCPYCNLTLCEEAIKAFPKLPFVMAHAGGVSEGVEKAVKLVNTYENAYIDTCGFEFSDTWIEHIADKADKTKILFGSDVPFHDIRGGALRILLADLDDDTKTAILGGNFRKMLLKKPRKI
jgi:predicted TIM-barrel fold metal-dependent hydrolase